MRTLLTVALIAVIAAYGAACGGDKDKKAVPEGKSPKTTDPGSKDPGSKDPGTPPPAASAYKVVDVKDGGTIKGKVAWDGDRPKVEAFPINKNPEVCDLDKTGKRASTRLVINDAGGVKNAVVFLEGITEGKAHGKGPYLLNQEGCDYHPHIMIVPKKSEVTIKSSDSILHNVHMFGAANYNIPFPKPMELNKKLRKAGIVRLQCDAGHGWMTAYFHSVEHPYYAITGADGSFEIANIPPGKYKLSMWHEHWDVIDKTEKDGQVATYTFAEPITQTVDVEVVASGSATVDFAMK